MKFFSILMSLVVSLSVANSLAQSLTSERTFQMNLSDSGLTNADLDITLGLNCRYQKEIIDFPFFRKTTVTESCGEKTMKLKNSNGLVTLPALSFFKKSKGDNLENYTLSLIIKQKDAPANKSYIFEMYSHGQQVTQFYQRSLDMSLQKIELQDVRVDLDGVSVANSNLFSSKSAELIVRFGGNIFDRESNNDFSLSSNRLNVSSDLFSSGFLNVGPHYYVQFAHKAAAEGELMVEVKSRDGKRYGGVVRTAVTAQAFHSIRNVDLHLIK